MNSTLHILTLLFHSPFAVVWCEKVANMADEAPKKRSFRKYSYRGVDLEQLLDMKTDQLVELFGARQRRRYVFFVFFH